MQFYDVIKNRSSIKNYKSADIEEDKLARIVNAAMLSPSWENKTSYKFIVVSDNYKKEMLSQAIMNDAGEAASAVKTAPITAVVVADPEESGVIGNKEYYLVDGAIAMEHFVLAATNEGYGTCWIGAVDEQKVRQALSIPDNFNVIAMTPVGEFEENKEHFAKKDVREHIFLNNWGSAYTKSQIH